ncbi:phage holin family protein [Wukongibacter sp. M2B1]|uniref:phage holin family protein n=1 Tax=Wukongibacter sp. M2B1 TaxID=3088895 RepID=UPI003D7B98BA
MEKIITYIKIASAGICTFLGGYDMTLKVLFVFMAIDILTGVLMALYNQEINSKKAYRGGIKKIGMLLVISLAFKLDQFFGTDFVRNAAIGYYVATEGISILENWGKMELPLPSFIKSILIQLKEKSDKGKDSGVIE